jgi:hypothetical protein
MTTAKETLRTMVGLVDLPVGEQRLEELAPEIDEFMQKVRRLDATEFGTAEIALVFAPGQEGF